MKALTLKAAKAFGVVVDENSKIPASCFNLSPMECKSGQKMKTSGGICEGCYAMKAYRMYPSVRKSQDGNQALFEQALNGGDIQGWIEAIAYQIQASSDKKAKKGKDGAGMHRWFSAGDLPSVDALRAIVKVCELTPTIKHWLPTREYKFVSQYLNALGHIPDNLNIRLSDAKIDQLKGKEITGCTQSAVHKNNEARGMECPSIHMNGECRNCTACWDKDVKTVSYLAH